MLKQAIVTSLAWNYVRREHASLQIYTPLKPLLSACARNSSFAWSIRDAYICSIANDANPSYRPATNETLVQLDIMPDICGASNATNNDHNPSECPPTWSEMIDGWWRRVNNGWDMSPHIRDAVFRGDESWYDVSIQGDWMQVEKTLECLEGVHPAVSKATVLVERPKTCSYPFDYISYPVPTLIDVKRTATALLETMPRLPNLRTFRMQIPTIHADWFDTSLSTNDTVKAPATAESNDPGPIAVRVSSNYTNSITSLILGPFTHPLITHTPHLTNITLHAWSFWDSRGPQNALIAVLRRNALPVEHMELKEISYPGILADAALALPGLKSLELQDAAVDWWGDDLNLKELLPGLSLFTNVTNLSLPPAQALDRYYNVPDCGNAWIDDPEFGEVMHKEYLAAMERLLETVKTGLKVVTKVRFGGGRWYDLCRGEACVIQQEANDT